MQNMARWSYQVVTVALLSACMRQAQPFLSPTHERDFRRAVAAARQSSQIHQALSLPGATGVLIAVSTRLRAPVVTLLAHGPTAETAVAFLMDSSPETRPCAHVDSQVTLFVSVRAAGMPITVVDCDQVASEVALSREAREELKTLQSHATLARVQVDSLSSRVEAAERLLAESVTIDLVQQDMLVSRGATVDSLATRVRDLAVRVRRLALATRVLSDSVTTRWQGLEASLARLEAAMAKIR